MGSSSFHSLLLLLLPLLAAPAGAATFTVTNTADAGAGSLRQAMLDAAGGGTDTIVFNIPGGGVKKIAPLTPLPTVSGAALVLDATTQPGYAVGAPVVELSGENLSGANARGLSFSNLSGASPSAVRGFIINRFESSGIHLLDCRDIAIEACFIGTDASGTQARPNYEGIVAQFAASASQGIKIGGGTAATRNVISGNQFLGLDFFGGDTHSIRGNYIGVDKTGQVALPNGFGAQLLIFGSTIGGPTAAEGNVISGNTSGGLFVDSSGHTIQNNLIGVAADRVTAMGNGREGLRIGNALGLAIVGNHLVRDNLIAYNGIGGVNVLPAFTPPTGVRLLGNAIFENGGPAIDLGDDGPTANDAGDADAGPNNLQNFPVLSAAFAVAAGTNVQGTLTSAASASYRLEFFAATRNAREGRRLLGSADVTTNAAGDAAFNLTVPGAVFSGEFVTATATRNTAPLDTSEFSAAVPVTLASLVVTNTNDAGPGSLRQAILDANATPEAKEIAFAIPPLNGTTKTIDLLSALPALTTPVALNALTQNGATPTAPRIELNGTSAGPTASGLTANADHVMIQGLVVNRFAGAGIFVATGNDAVVQYNRLGTNQSGSSALPNGVAGLALSFANRARVLENLLSGNGGAGLFLGSSSNCVIQGNRIGLNNRETAALPNAQSGILINGNSTGNLVGGTAAGQGNVIAGNTAAGLTFSGTGTGGNRVEGNFVGTDSTGAPFGNAVGISIEAGAHDQTIGGTAAGAGNRIAGQTGAGVAIIATGGVGNRVLGNLISGNGGLGLDLGAAGVTANDAGDADSGANNLQNFPVLTAAQSYFAGLTVDGTLGSVANADYRLEFFASPACSASGNGEGATYLGALEVQTGAGGSVTFSTTLPAIVPVGQVVTATATRLATGDTSEFSACRAVTALAVPTLTVTNTNDTGAGSLRQALLDANANANPNQIVFNIPGAGVKTIAPLGALPTLTAPVVIDGLTQPGATASAPLIELNGQSAGTGTSGLRVAGSAVIQGLVINRFDGHGLLFETLGNNVVKSCRIGLDPTGQIARGNGRCGIYLDQVSGNVIGGTAGDGNLISANNTLPTNQGGDLFDAGLSAFSSSNNFIQGNTFGPTSTDASTGVGQRIGILLTNGTANQIGGASAAARNVVVCSGHGIYLRNSNGNLVQGNYVGLNRAGLPGTGLSNLTNGVRIESAGSNRIVGNVISNTVGGAGDGLYLLGTLTVGTVVQGNWIGLNGAGTGEAPNGTGIQLDVGAEAFIGGRTAGEGNVISGNNQEGIRLATTGGNPIPPRATIEGNLIGLAPDGSTVFPNATGVQLDFAATGIQVGSGGAGRNVISGNSVGLSLVGSGNVVQNNLIGTDASGTLARANTIGIRLQGSNNTIGGASGASGNVISGNGTSITTGGVPDAVGNTIQSNFIGTRADGSTALPNSVGLRLDSSGNTIRQNVIAFHGGPGVAILGSGAGNRILDNAIFSNGNPGIDLGGDGVTPNDAGDADTGANLRQNFPVLTEAASTVEGTLSSAPNATFTLQFFLNASGGQGRTALGQLNVTTDAAGLASFSFVPTLVTAPLPPGQTVTATATDAAGNTSEFSALVNVHGTYESWAAANGIPGALRGDDFDQDGIPNFVEYALGLNPTAPSVLPALSGTGATRTLTIPKGVEAAFDPGVAYRFQVSSDLQNWGAPLAPTSDSGTQAVFTLTVGPGKQFVRFVAVSQ
ncbi:MAG: right-handed parallel beta-helix repeat-containing protein [Verrucomicrobia bacterium]|nr:right-handed parallel beta-helix repeat-containing protein [Verrucomicrobiota bacterium]